MSGFDDSDINQSKVDPTSRPQTELLLNKQSFCEQDLYFEDEDAGRGTRVNESADAEQAGAAKTMSLNEDVPHNLRDSKRKMLFETELNEQGKSFN